MSTRLVLRALMSLMAVCTLGTACASTTQHEHAADPAQSEVRAPADPEAPGSQPGQLREPGLGLELDTAKEEPSPPPLESARLPADGGSSNTGGRPWMGIEMSQAERGVVIDGVFPGSPAASAGLLAGDRFLTIAGEVIVRPVDVHAVLDNKSVGDSLVITVHRQGQERLLRLLLTSKPESTELMQSLYQGKPAPSISTLQTVQGAVVPSLEQLRGDVIVLEFWATWCVACRAMSPVLNEWHEQLAVRGLRVLAVTSEPFAEVQHNLPQLGLRHPVFVDEDTEVSRAYRASAIPTLFLIDRQGTVAEVMVGYNPLELRAFEARMAELLREPAP